MGLTHWSLCMCPPDKFWEGWEHTIKQKNGGIVKELFPLVIFMEHLSLGLQLGRRILKERIYSMICAADLTFWELTEMCMRTI